MGLWVRMAVENVLMSSLTFDQNKILDVFEHERA